MQHLKILFRTFARSKVLSTINLLGLALGISSCLFIVLYVADELSYDYHHKNLDRIYRVTMDVQSETTLDHIAISSAALPQELKKSFPEVEKAVRFIKHDAETTVKQGDVIYQEKDLYDGDAEIFDVFSYTFISGDPKTALVQPRSVVLTESMAKKYFGAEDPLGKTLTIGKEDHLITGIIEDLPLNSDMRFTLISSLDSTDQSTQDWFDFSYYNYVLFNEKSLATPDFLKVFVEKLNKICDVKVNDPLRTHDQTITISFGIQPLKGIHFQSGWQYDTPKGNESYVIIFSAVAVLLLIIACLNYINFSIVQSIERSKEVGIRKVAGAGFYQLVSRYLGQSLLLTMLSVIIAIVVVALLLPSFNEITSKAFTISDLADLRIIGAMSIILLLVGVLAGSYPAFYTSSIKAVNALKGKISTPRGQVIRKVSITSQFVISSGLVICTAIAFNQMTFIRNYDLGFRQNNVVVVSVEEDSLKYENLKSLRDKISAHAGIERVALSFEGTLPGEPTELGSVNIKSTGKDLVRMVNYARIDEDFIPALNIGIKEGRNFEKGSISDQKNSMLVNEALVRMMGWKNPMEEKINWQGGYRNIIGIVRDYHYLSLHNKVDPMIFVPNDSKVTNLIVVMEKGSGSDQIDFIRAEWNKTFGEQPFVYRFLDESVAAQYSREETAMTVFTYFSVLTIVISCLGLFGLSSLTVYQRRREIGIRKAIGASFRSLIVLFSREYMLLITLSLAIVAPLCWYLTDSWLKEFQFKSDVPVHLYAIAGVSILLVSLATIVLSITRVSGAKPSELIRD